jgi:phosphate transport system substrate-binding protein
MLFYQEQDPAKAEVLRNLVEFGLTEGQKMAPELGYIPLPDNVIEKVREASAKIQ